MKRVFIIMFTFWSIITLAQNKKEINLNEGSINEKFDAVYSQSNNYKDYKVIKRDLLVRLKKQVLDSLHKQNAAYQVANRQIDKLNLQINKQAQKTVQLENTIKDLQVEKDDISFLGFPIKKLQYQLIMWSLVFLLALALIYFILKFKNSHQITLATKKNLEKIEDEYNTFRTNALEREQLLKRQLLDEKKKYQA